VALVVEAFVALPAAARHARHASGLGHQWERGIADRVANQVADAGTDPAANPAADSTADSSENAVTNGLPGFPCLFPGFFCLFSRLRCHFSHLIHVRGIDERPGTRRGCRPGRGCRGRRRRRGCRQRRLCRERRWGWWGRGRRGRRLGRCHRGGRQQTTNRSQCSSHVSLPFSISRVFAEPWPGCSPRPALPGSGRSSPERES